MKIFPILILILSVLAGAKSHAVTWNVPVLYWSMKIEGQVAMRKGFEEEIEKFNQDGKDKIQILPFVAGEDRKGILNQVKQFDDVLTKNPPAVVIQPTDNSALASGLHEANNKKIPVITYDQYIVNGSILSYLTSDNYQAGVDNGEYINRHFSPLHNIRIVVFEYPRVSSTMERIDGFFDSLRKSNRPFTVVKRYQAVDPASGAKAVKEFLHDFPRKGSVDLILTVNDGGGLTIVKSLADKKRTELAHATFDGDPESVKNIRDKKLTVIDSAQFCAELGRETARTLIAHLQGKKVESKKLVPTFPVTRETIDRYPGWMGVPGPQRVAAADPLRSPAPYRRDTDRLIVKIGIAPLCPYLCEKGPGKWGGYLYDILQEVANRNGFILQLESIQQGRLLTTLQMRRVNYIIGPASLVRYSPEVRVVGPALGVSFVGALHHADDKVTLVDEEFLKDKRVVYADVSGDGSDGIFDSVNTPRLRKLTGSDAADRMVKMLSGDRFDIALGDYNVLSYSLLLKAGTTVQLAPTSLAGFNSLVLVSMPREPEFGGLPSSLDNWFADARKNGQLQKILDRYNLKDWRLFLRN